jgi:hypothetical protein
MRWYKLASRPPAYVQERVSDIRHAAETAMVAPSDARKMLSGIISQLKSNHDDEYAKVLDGAVALMLDSPSRAGDLMREVAEAMLSDKRRKDTQEKRRPTPWKTR